MMETERDMNPENIEDLNKRPSNEHDAEFARQAHHQAYHDVVVKQFGNWDEQVQDKFFQSAWSGSSHEIISFNGQDCGYFSMEETDNSIELHELVLLPKFQGKGIGTKILNEVIEKAKAAKLPVHLQVLKENKAADLYRRMGFKENGETDTHFQMELSSEMETDV